MFGKRMGLFGSARLGNGIMPGDQQSADLGDFTGMFRVPTDAGTSIPSEAPTKAKPGFNDVGGWGEKLALIGSVLTGDGGNSPALAPFLLRRQQELAARQSQQQRAQDWEDWQRKQEWEAAHRPPAAPHYWETNDGSLAMVGPDGQPKVLYKDPTPKTEYQTVRNPDGTITVYPMPQVGGAPAVPTSPVGKLRPIGGGSGGNVGGGFHPGY